MDIIETPEQVVLSGYGHFVDSLLINLYQISDHLSPRNESSSSIGFEIINEGYYNISEMTDNNNKIQNNVLIVFSSISKEIDCMKEILKSKYLDHILYYGINCREGMNDVEAQILFSEIFPVLVDILNFVKRCRKVLLHLLDQLFSTYEDLWNSEASNIVYVKFQEVFKSLGELLLLFVTLDVAFSCGNGSKILFHSKTFWNGCRPLVSDEEHAFITKSLLEIQDDLLSGNIFEGTTRIVSQKFPVFGKKNSFILLFHRFLRGKLSDIEVIRENENLKLRCWARIAVSYVFSYKCCGISDKKIHRILLDLSKKFVAVPLFGGLVWVPGKFLSTHLDSKNNEDAIGNSVFQKFMDQIEPNLVKEIKTFCCSVLKWSLHMENLASLDAKYSKLYDTDIIWNCIEGFYLACQIRFFSDNILQIHSRHGQPMTKILVLHVCKLVELLKGIRTIFRRHYIMLAKQTNHSIQKKILQMLNVLLKKKNDFSLIPKGKSRNANSSLIFCEKALYGSCSDLKLLLVRFALTITNPLSSNSESNEQLMKFLNDVETILNFPKKMEKVTNSNLILIEGDILPVFIKHLMDTYSNGVRLQYILHSAEKHKYQNGSDRNLLYGDIKDQMRNKINKLLCEDVEIHLRLHAHSHLKEEYMLPNRNKDYKALLKNVPINVYDSLMTVKDFVETYLDKTFYDLTTVALHDWQTYREMRSLGEHLFKLETVEDNLPSQTLSQGLDVLEIMRNIHVFVCKYLYNLNTQCFIEFSSNNKHLNAIQIHQVAKSIWTHGTGIMNTTTNFIYQFLKKKLLICSQFLYDEHINSRLTKDLKMFNQCRLNKNATYPYERAQKFNKGISRLKAPAEGHSYLDQYRILISQIGNALGYVRMVRSGGLHQSLATITYYPFSEPLFLSQNSFNGPTCDTYICFEQMLHRTLHNLNGGTDSLMMLVDVFRTVFYSSENEHLRLFVMIVPPLTINYINYIIASKEKLSKRNCVTGHFTDDGFAMGIAYLLWVFKLNEEFDSLHWFKSVEEKYRMEEILQATSSENNDRGDSNNENTSKLSIKRLQMYKQEYELLQYSLNSARVFFSGER